MGQKSRADVLKSFLMFIFTVPIILSDAEISAALGYVLKSMTCGTKMVKNHHFSTFDDFFFHFGQTGLSCSHLPNFASQKFLHQVRNFCKNGNFKNCSKTYFGQMKIHALPKKLSNFEFWGQKKKF